MIQFFKPQNKNGPIYIQQVVQQPDSQQGPMYQQPQIYYQNQGGYLPQQGAQPLQYQGNQDTFIEVQPPQYGGYPQQLGYLPPNYNQGIYQPQSIGQAMLINFNLQSGMGLTNNNLCLYCFRPYTLIVQRKIGGQVFIAFLLLLIFFWPLCWLPFILDECKDKYYYCSQCGKLMYKRQYTMSK